MVPAQQRLHRVDLSCLSVDLRLIVQHELLLSRGPVQVALQAQALARPCVHLLGEELVAVSTLLLGAVHGGVGVFRSVWLSSPSPGRG